MDTYDEHLKNALKEVKSALIEIDGHCVVFPIQSGPIGESGINGCDAADLMRYTIGLYRSFNHEHPCRENSITITKLEEAVMWQEKRTAERAARGVEGTNQD